MYSSMYVANDLMDILFNMISRSVNVCMYIFCVYYTIVCVCVCVCVCECVCVYMCVYHMCVRVCGVGERAG